MAEPQAEPQAETPTVPTTPQSQSRASIRLQEFDTELEAEVIDLKRIRKLCHAGIPDKAGIRSVYWKILLGYLPPERAQWDAQLEKQRKLYTEFVQEFILDTHSDDAVEQDPLGALLTDPLGALGMDDTAQEVKPNTWDTYFKDNDTIEQIHKDVQRLCPEFAFFQGPANCPRPKGITPIHKRVHRQTLSSESFGSSRSGVTTVTLKKSQEELENDEQPVVPVGAGEEYHWEVIERILFIYAKLNPGIGYIQGMNEICGPLYYVMASNPDAAWNMHSEADTYWCFMMLLAEFRDNFIKTLDNSDFGIGSLMRRLTRLVRDNDPELHADLEKKGIKPMFYGFRWLTCLLTQEFPLPDVIRLWDSMFSKMDRQKYLLGICVGMLLCVRDEVIAGSFADNVKLLQHLDAKNLDPNMLLAKADGIVKRMV